MCGRTPQSNFLPVWEPPMWHLPRHIQRPLGRFLQNLSRQRAAHFLAEDTGSAENSDFDERPANRTRNEADKFGRQFAREGSVGRRTPFASIRIDFPDYQAAGDMSGVTLT